MKCLHYSLYYTLICTYQWWYFIGIKTKQKSITIMLAPQFESAQNTKATFYPAIWNIILWDQIIRLNFALAGNHFINKPVYMKVSNKQISKVGKSSQKWGPFSLPSFSSPLVVGRRQGGQEGSCFSLFLPSLNSIL